MSSIKWATVNFELAKLFPSPTEQIELACFPTGGGNARGGLDGIAKGFSAHGLQQPIIEARHPFFLANQSR